MENEKPIKGLEKYVGEFYQDRVNEFNQMQIMRKDNSLDKLRALAHKWKGFCAPYGFQTLESLSAELEKSCIAKDIVKIDNLLHQVSEYLVVKGKIVNE